MKAGGDINSARQRIEDRCRQVGRAARTECLSQMQAALGEAIKNVPSSQLSKAADQFEQVDQKVVDVCVAANPRSARLQSVCAYKSYDDIHAQSKRREIDGKTPFQLVSEISPKVIAEATTAATTQTAAQAKTQKIDELKLKCNVAGKQAACLSTINTYKDKLNLPDLERLVNNILGSADPKSKAKGGLSFGAEVGLGIKKSGSADVAGGAEGSLRCPDGPGCGGSEYPRAEGGSSTTKTGVGGDVGHVTFLTLGSLFLENVWNVSNDWQLGIGANYTLHLGLFSNPQLMGSNTTLLHELALKMIIKRRVGDWRYLGVDLGVTASWTGRGISFGEEYGVADPDLVDPLWGLRLSAGYDLFRNEAVTVSAEIVVTTAPGILNTRTRDGLNFLDVNTDTGVFVGPKLSF